MDKWIVNIKGKPNSNSFEISVVKSTFEHGIKSYGWFGENKLLVSNSGGSCNNMLILPIWNRTIELAHKFCEELNNNPEWQKEIKKLHEQTNPTKNIKIFNNTRIKI